MKNPLNIYEHETEPRPTIYRMAQVTGISQPAIWHWFNGDATPRAVNSNNSPIKTMYTTQRKYHYWRGFTVATLLS